MNSTEFKKLLLTEPGSKDPEFLAMAKSDAASKAMYAEAMAFESQLESALQIPVPDGLAERIITEHAVASQHSSKLWSYQSAFGLAAAVVLGIGIAMYQPFSQSSDLQNFIVEHMTHEPGALMATDDVSFEDTKWLFAKYGASVSESFGRVTYLQRCPMLSKTGIHMVLQTAHGAVTVFFMPEEKLSETLLVQGKGIDGVIVGMKNASMAIIGSPGQSLQSVERRLRSAIKTI